MLLVLFLRLLGVLSADPPLAMPGLTKFIFVTPGIANGGSANSTPSNRLLGVQYYWPIEPCATPVGNEIHCCYTWHCKWRIGPWFNIELIPSPWEGVGRVAAAATLSARTAAAAAEEEEFPVLEATAAPAPAAVE